MPVSVGPLVARLAGKFLPAHHEQTVLAALDERKKLPMMLKQRTKLATEKQIEQGRAAQAQNWWNAPLIQNEDGMLAKVDRWLAQWFPAEPPTKK